MIYIHVLYNWLCTFVHPWLFCFPFSLLTFYDFLLSVCLRVIPQGTVDNNLGPDRLAGPKALNPNYYRQPTLWLHDLCLEVLIVHGNELRLFGARAFSLTHTINVSMHWTHHQTPQTRGFSVCLQFLTTLPLMNVVDLV